MMCPEGELSQVLPPRRLSVCTSSGKAGVKAALGGEPCSSVTAPSSMLTPSPQGILGPAEETKTVPEVSRGPSSRIQNQQLVSPMAVQ